jgi:hypothetical protein
MPHPADLDGDKRDELYCDNQKEVRRYDWTPKGWRHEVLWSTTTN